MDEQGKSDDTERRHGDRRPVTLVVDYEGADDLVGDYTENLSEGGTFVHTERDFENGTRIRLLLSFPGLLKPLALEGVVRWSRRDDGEAGVGIEFDDHDEETKSRLERVVKAINARDPEYVGRLVRVLVVEDNPHVARLIRDGLGGSAKRIGANLAFDFQIANDGREALERLKTDEFDALIIDVYLPILDGASVIAHVRKQEHLKGIPIIAVSGGGAPARQSAMDAGADFFLDKPMRLRHVIETMRQLIELADSSSSS